MTFIGEGDWVWFNAGGADIDGTPGSDVLLHVDELTGNRVHTRITSLSGATGGVRWDFVSRP